MGDPNVSNQIEEIRQQIHHEAERGRARMAGIEEQVARLTDAFTTVTTIASQRAYAAATGRPLTLVPEPRPATVTHRRRRVLLAAITAAVAAAAGLGLLAADEGPTPATTGNSGPLTASRGGEHTHGPASYPPAPSPASAATDINAPTEPGRRRPEPAPVTAVPPVAGGGQDQHPGPAPTPDPVTSVTSPDGTDCGLGIQIRRITVCRAAQRN